VQQLILLIVLSFAFSCISVNGFSRMASAPTVHRRYVGAGQDKAEAPPAHERQSRQAGALTGDVVKTEPLEKLQDNTSLGDRIPDPEDS